MKRHIFIGYDSREVDAYKVAEYSLRKHATDELHIQPLVREDMRAAGIYARDANEPASTEFAYSRFFVPYLMGYKGWALFIDCDFLFTKDVGELFDFWDNKYAVMCVHHNYTPRQTIKMDGQKQVPYFRKNWSSMMLFNCGHSACKRLDLSYLNRASGADLHQFKWLNRSMHVNELGEVPLEWNWLEGEYDKPEEIPAVIHYTQGGPWFTDYQQCDYADEWREAAREAGLNYV